LKKKKAPRDRSRLTRFFFLPSIFTTLNLLLGYLALMQVMKGRFTTAVLLITGAVIMDGFDGTIARLLKSESNFGVQLDSLTDGVTFGLVPAILISSWGFQNAYPQIGQICGFLYLSAGVIRLARFNVFKEADAFPANIFIGLPIPVAAMAVGSPVLLRGGTPPQLKLQIVAFALFSFLISLLMISNIHYRTKKKMGTRNSLQALLILALMIALLVLYPWTTIPVLTLIYVVSPIFIFLWRKIRHRGRSAEKAPSPPAVETGEPRHG